MASHFKTPDDDTERTPAGARHSSRSGNSARSHARVNPTARRGGDESYHAPASNPYAANTPRSSSAHYIPAVSSQPAASSSRRRSRSQSRSRADGRFVETDPYDLSGRRSGDSKKRTGRIVSTVLFVVGIVLVLVAAGMWIYNQWRYSEQEALNERLATYVEVSDDGSTPPEVDWEGLKAINDEVVGWVQIPGTVVNYPVYQATDNQKYLRTAADGSYTIGGQLFLDCDNTAPGMVDNQSVIYGHHLRNGSMFKAVSDMVNQEMFDSVTTIWYVTEDATYELEPLLIYMTDASDTEARHFTFDSEDEFHEYLTDLLNKSEARCDDAADVIERTTNVLTLCTCNYEYSDDARTLLVCVPKATEGA